MRDFTSALYLGMRHPSASLGAWDQLSLGRPAALEEPPGARAFAAALARLVGCEAATVLPSTLHLFWDLFGMLARERVALLVDSASYPIARWGAQAHGLPTHTFGSGDLGALARLTQHWSACGRRPVILADGYTPGSGRVPPLAAYAALAASCGGLLVLDDTQVLGLFGRRAGLAPYGHGGGGSLRWHGLSGAHLVVGASLAKAFGAPLAVLCAGAELVARFEDASQTRSHTSPPSVAVLRAAQQALMLNRRQGDQLRWHLWRLVTHWRGALARRGLASHGGDFPLQTVLIGPPRDGASVQAALLARGVRAVAQQAGRHGAVSFLLRANHSENDIDMAADALADCLAPQAPPHLLERA